MKTYKELVSEIDEACWKKNGKQEMEKKLYESVEHVISGICDGNENQLDEASKSKLRGGDPSKDIMNKNIVKVIIKKGKWAHGPAGYNVIGVTAAGVEITIALGMEKNLANAVAKLVKKDKKHLDDVSASHSGDKVDKE